MLTTALQAAGPTLMVFAGSTREGSLNKKLAKEAVRVAEGLGANVFFVDLLDYPMPFYNGDLEKNEGMPEIVKAFRRLMVNSDVIMIASPEYNASFSALLKNALDWSSRGEAGGSSREAFKGKKFVLMSAVAGSKGGARSLLQLKAVIEDVGGQVLPEQVVVNKANDAFDEHDHLKDPAIIEQLNKAVSAAIN